MVMVLCPRFFIWSTGSTSGCNPTYLCGMKLRILKQLDQFCECVVTAASRLEMGSESMGSNPLLCTAWRVSQPFIVTVSCPRFQPEMIPIRRSLCAFNHKSCIERCQKMNERFLSTCWSIWRYLSSILCVRKNMFNSLEVPFLPAQRTSSLNEF